MAGAAGLLLGALAVEGARGRRRCDGRCGERQEPGGRAEGSRRSRVGEARAGPSHASGTHPGLGAATSHPPPTTIRRRGCARPPPWLAKHLDRPAEDLDRAAVVHALDSLSRRHKDKGMEECRPRSVGPHRWPHRRLWPSVLRLGDEARHGAQQPVRRTADCRTAINKRDRVLSDEEAAAIWRAAGEAPLPYGAIVRLLMLTGQRREEVAGMTWAELSEDLATWTIPATRTKNGIPHLVPLSQPARELLHALPSDRPGDVQGAHQRAKLALVFPGERGTPFSGWSKAKSALDTASGVSGWWLHDLRRTLATGLQRLGVRLEVTEAVLNHLSGSRAGVVGIYQRHDWAEEKRAALDAWSAHLLAAAEGRLTAGKVLPFSRAGSGEM